MTFKKITIIDQCGLTSEGLEKISALSGEKITVYNDFPASDKEIVHRMAGSDCVLVSWHTKITADILQACKSLKYVGMCCSLYDENSANVDITAARKLGIVVKGVRDYGDEGTVEFIFAQLIFLLKGLGKCKWREESVELKGKSIGIIGLGTLGQMVANTALHFGMNVYYFSRTRKPDIEKSGITFLPLSELLETCDMITTHLPKNTVLLTEREFRNKKANSILINTSLGLTFEKQAFLDWLHRDKSSFAILDGDGIGPFGDEFAKLDNIIMSEQFAGFTHEAKNRLSEKVVVNMTDYLGCR